MTDWKALRAHFPALANKVWVNAAAMSPLPLPVHQAARTFYDSLLENGDRDFPTWLQARDETRQILATTLGVRASEIGFTQNTSHSMNLVVSMLRDMGVEEVVTLASEFPATTLPLLHHGLRIRWVEPQGGFYDPATIEAAMGPDTRAIVCSHVQFGLGSAQDLAALGAIARSRGALLVVNATQSLGARPVEVQAAGADFLVATGHKWVCAGFGAGMLWVRQSILDAHRFPFAGWQSTAHPELMDNRVLELPHEARAAELGTPAFDAPIRLGAALRLLGDVGYEAIHQRIVELTDGLRAGLRRLGLPPLTPDDPAIRSGITSVEMPGAEKVVEALAASGVFASARRGSLRLALHAYNDEEDVERTLQALGQTVT